MSIFHKEIKNFVSKATEQKLRWELEKVYSFVNSRDARDNVFEKYAM